MPSSAGEAGAVNPNLEWWRSGRDDCHVISKTKTVVAVITALVTESKLVPKWRANNEKALNSASANPWCH